MTVVIVVHVVIHYWYQPCLTKHYTQWWIVANAIHPAKCPPSREYGTRLEYALLSTIHQIAKLML